MNLHILISCIHTYVSISMYDYVCYIYIYTCMHPCVHACSRAHTRTDIYYICTYHIQLQINQMQFAVYVDDYTIVQVYMDKHNMLTAQCVNTCADHVKTRHTHTHIQRYIEICKYSHIYIYIYTKDICVCVHMQICLCYSS